jgi:hypothetical protein
MFVVTGHNTNFFSKLENSIKTKKLNSGQESAD